MGTSIWMRSPSRDLDETYCKEKGTLKLSLSKNYNDFANGYEAIGENCDFAQIQNIFEIDLSPFRVFNHAGMVDTLSDEEIYRDYLLKKAKTEKEKEKITKEYAIRIERIKISEAEQMRENWVEMEQLKSTIISLQMKMKSNQDLFEKIDFKIMNKRNFIPNPLEEKKVQTKKYEEQLKKFGELDVNDLFKSMNGGGRISPADKEFIKREFVNKQKMALEMSIKSLKENIIKVSAYNINHDFDLMLEFIEYATKRGEHNIAFYIM